MSTSRQALVGDLGVALQAYQRSVQAFDDAVGRRLGLGPADLRCLDWLTGGAMTAGELSTATGLRPAATTALIDRLSAKGLVRRRPDPSNRRQVFVEMTEEGQAATWSFYGPLVEDGQHLLAAMSAEELVRLRDLLDVMREVTDRQRERIQSV